MPQGWTEEQVQALAQRIDVSNFPIKLGIKLHGHGMNTELMLSMAVKDIYRRNVTIDILYNTVLSLRDQSKEGALEIIYEHIKTFILHELSECFLVDGKRKFNDGMHP